MARKSDAVPVKISREIYDQIKDYSLIHSKNIQQIVDRGLTWWLETEAEATTEDKLEKMATAAAMKGLD